MKFPLMKVMALLIIGVAVVTVGCSNNEVPAPVFSGKDGPASVDAGNAEVMGTASTVGVQLSINTMTTDMVALAGVIYRGLRVYSGSGSQQSNVNNLPTGISIPVNLIGQNFCGGSVSTDDLITPGFTNATFVFQDVCYESQVNGQVIINGQAQIVRSATSFAASFIEFAVNRNGETQVLKNYTISCTATECTAYSDFEGPDGNIYRISDFSVVGDSVTGYQVGATLFHPEFGSVVLETTVAITLNCESGHPNAGTLEFTGASGSLGSITFRDDCSGYDGSYNDGVNSGTFSGNWS